MAISRWGEKSHALVSCYSDHIVQAGCSRSPERPGRVLATGATRGDPDCKLLSYPRRLGQAFQNKK